MQLNLQNFQQILQQQAAAVQNATTAITNFAAGSVARAILEATSSISLWLQAMNIQVLSATRLATSTGLDVDSFLADYGLIRQAASPATGNVTFTRYSTINTAILVPGVQLSTADGTQTYIVTASVTNTAWNVALGAYQVAAGTSTLTVPVQANTPGSGGNVGANTVILIQTACPFDLVTNPTAFINGANAASDQAARAEFAAYIQTRSLATVGAIQYTAQTVQSGVTAYVAEDVDTSGNYKPGNFVVTIDDGTGTPPTSLVNSVYAAVNLVRGAGITFAVQPPTLITATVVLTITVASGYTKTILQPQVQTALAAYIGSLPVGSALPFTEIAAKAYAVSPGITNVTAITLNGGTADLGGGATQVVRAGTITVN